MFVVSVCGWEKGPWSHHVPSPHTSLEDIFRYLDRSYRIFNHERQQKQGQTGNGYHDMLECRCRVVGPREGWDLTPDNHFLGSRVWAHFASGYE